MVNVVKSPSLRSIINDGDHIQLFFGKVDPQTGQERQLMTVWCDNVLVWSGPVDHDVLEDLRYIRRPIRIQLPVRVLKNFHKEGLCYGLS